jgi:hypothetical protein
MLWLARVGDCACNSWVRENIFQKELTPAFVLEVSSPQREFLASNRAEQAAPLERPINDDRRAFAFCQGQ